MKVIFKIIRHVPEEKVISVKICRLHSHKSIDNYSSKRVDYSGFNFTDNDTFIDSLITKCNHRIDRQDEKEEILRDNIPIDISGELDIDNLVGKVIDGKVRHRDTRILKMRRVEL